MTPPFKAADVFAWMVECGVVFYPTAQQHSYKFIDATYPVLSKNIRKFYKGFPDRAHHNRCHSWSCYIMAEHFDPNFLDQMKLYQELAS